MGAQQNLSVVDRKSAKLQTITLIVLGLILAGLVAWGIKGLLSPHSEQRESKTKISILPTTPPPPPPPPPKEQPKEVPKEQTKAAQVDQPKALDRPPDEQLKMEGAAGNGPSPFAAGTVSKDYIGQPTGGGGGGASRMQFGLYSASLQRFLQGELGKNSGLRSREYRVTLKIWLSRDGGLQNYELVGSSGDADVDSALKEALAKITSVQEAPPENMPQPVRVRVSNRSLG